MLLIYLFLFFIIFQNIVLQFLPSFFSYWDELLCIFICCCFFYCLFKSKNLEKTKVDKIFFLLIIFLIFVGCLGNVIFNFQSSKIAILKDIVGAFKFPIVFYMFYRMSFSNTVATYLTRITGLLKKIVIIIFVFGIISIFVDFGMNQEEIRYFIHPYMFLFSHPTYLTTCMICILCILNATNEASFKIDFVILANIILAMRTKGFVFIAVYIFLKYFTPWLEKKLIQWNSNIIRYLKYIYGLIIGLIIILVASKKLLLYASYSNSPRESLYLGSFNIMKMCFPIGSGFATFASHLSGKYYSLLYDIIHVAGFYEWDGSISVDIGDAGIPYYLAQFGFIGILLFILLFYIMFKISFSNIENDKKQPVIYMWLLIIISIFSEAILVNNGVELAVIFVLIINICSNPVYDQEKIILKGNL